MTATARSPGLQRTIGYLRLRDPGDGEERDITLEAADGARYPARIVALPFYDKEKRIPRGLAPAEGGSP